MAWSCHCYGCGVGQQLQLPFDPSPRTSRCRNVAIKRIFKMPQKVMSTKFVAFSAGRGSSCSEILLSFERDLTLAAHLGNTLGVALVGTWQSLSRLESFQALTGASYTHFI